MKGIIIEKNRKTVVLLLNDGTFKTMKATSEFEIGTVIYTNKTARETAFYIKKLVSMIAAAFIVVFLGAWVIAWTTPVQYINIDINPSVEFTINCFDRIIKVCSLNDDGKKLVDKISVRSQRFDNGITAVLDMAQELGYMKEDGDVLISVSSTDSSRKEKTQNEIKEKVSGDVEVLTFDTKTHSLSVQNGISPGKNNIIDKVIESGTSLNREELEDISIKELMLKVKENRKLDKELEKEAQLENGDQQVGFKEKNQNKKNENNRVHSTGSDSQEDDSGEQTANNNRSQNPVSTDNQEPGMEKEKVQFEKKEKGNENSNAKSNLNAESDKVKENKNENAAGGSYSNQPHIMGNKGQGINEKDKEKDKVKGNDKEKPDNNSGKVENLDDEGENTDEQEEPENKEKKDEDNQASDGDRKNGDTSENSSQEEKYNNSSDKNSDNQGKNGK